MASKLRWFPTPFWVFLKDPQGSVILTAQPGANAQYVISATCVWPGGFPVTGGPLAITFSVTSTGTPTNVTGPFNSLNDAYDACESSWGSSLQWFIEPLWLLLKDPQWSFIMWCSASPSIQYEIIPFVTNYPGTTFPAQGGPITIEFYAVSQSASFYGYYNSLKDAYDACQANWDSLAA